MVLGFVERLLTELVDPEQLALGAHHQLAHGLYVDLGEAVVGADGQLEIVDLAAEAGGNCELTKADEVVTPGGGMYYAQEAPGMPMFVKEGDHFEKGQPLFILEVMKMFNKIPAPFAGTVDKILIDGTDGIIVQKGQPIFKIIPDEAAVAVSAEEVAARRRAATGQFLQQL